MLWMEDNLRNKVFEDIKHVDEFGNEFWYAREIQMLLTYKRFYIRSQTKKGNYSLNQTAKNAGVRNFDKFHNAGYKGLYNGETADDIFKRKELRYREDILDNMSSSELIANLFRIDQTEQKLVNDNVRTEIEQMMLILR